MVDPGIFVLLQGRELVRSYVDHRCDGARLLSQSLALMLIDVRFQPTFLLSTSEAESGFDALRNDVAKLHA